MARPKGVDKIKLTLSVDESTKQRLEQYAFEHHTTMSQAITDIIWRLKVKDEQIPGQIMIK